MKLCVLHMWSIFKPGNLESFYLTYETASRVQEQSRDGFLYKNFFFSCIHGSFLHPPTTPLANRSSP
ncbi:hypothetical protein L873DRAFT_1814968, partial [Choiromyces venosus 120613-1]